MKPWSRSVRFLGLLSLLICRVVSAQEQAPPAIAGKSFLRLERTPQGEPIALQTSITSFSKQLPDGEKITVDLVGAVHVADREYYETLNKTFEQYEVVLYELVAPEGAKVPQGAKASNRNVAGALQNVLKGTLGLEHQLERIDYTRPNLVHADMSPEQFSASMEKRGESFMGMFFRMLAQGAAQQSRQAAQGKSVEADMFSLFFAKDRDLELKRIVAEQFEDMESTLAAFNGKEGSTIITERNRVALEELDTQIAAGHRHLAIFYGAAHLPDMAHHLTQDRAFTPTTQTWTTAWNLTPPAKANEK